MEMTFFLLLIKFRRGTPGERENSNRGVGYGNSDESSMGFPISNRGVGFHQCPMDQPRTLKCMRNCVGPREATASKRRKTAPFEGDLFKKPV